MFMTVLEICGIAFLVGGTTVMACIVGLWLVYVFGGLWKGHEDDPNVQRFIQEVQRQRDLAED